MTDIRAYVPCRCGSFDHFVHVACWWDQGEAPDFPVHLGIGTHPTPLFGRWSRFRLAWDILRGRQSQFSEVVLDPDELDRLIAVLVAAKAKASTAPVGA